MTNNKLNRLKICPVTDSDETVLTEEDILRVTNALQTTYGTQKKDALLELRKMLSVSNPPLDLVVAFGVVPTLIVSGLIIISLFFC